MAYGWDGRLTALRIAPVMRVITPVKARIITAIAMISAIWVLG